METEVRLSPRRGWEGSEDTLTMSEWIWSVSLSHLTPWYTDGETEVSGGEQVAPEHS